MLMNQLHSRSSASSSSSSVTPNIEAVVIPAQHQQFQHHQYMKKNTGKIGSSSGNNSSNTNNNPLGRFLTTNKLPKSSGGSTVSDERCSLVFHDQEEQSFRQQRKNMVHNNKLTRKESMSRSHSWIYGSVKQTSAVDGRPFDFGRNTRDHMPSYHHHHQHKCNNPDYCYDCSDLRSRTAAAVASSSCLPASSVRLKDRKNYLEEEEYYWKHFAFNDCPEHSPLRNNNKVANNCENNNNVNNTKKFVGSVRKLTWKSLKQVVVKKRPSLDNVLGNNKKQQQNPQQPPSSIPPANAPDILFVPNYFFPPVTKQNFYASCTDLCYEDQFPHQNHLAHLPTASVRVRPKQSRQPWPCEFGPLPNYHEERSAVQEDQRLNEMKNHVEQEDEDTEGIYHSEWDLRQFMPYDVWLSENSPLQSSNPNQQHARLLPKVKANSHSTTAAAVENSPHKREPPKTSSLEGQGYTREDPQQRLNNRQSILQSDVTAYELNNQSDEEISSSLSSFDSHSNSSSEDLKNDPPIPYHCRKLLPRVNGKFSQKSSPVTKNINYSTGTTNIVVNGTKVSPKINTRSTTNISKTPVVPTTPTKSPSDRKLNSSSPLKTIAAKSTNKNRVSQTPKSVHNVSTTPAAVKSEEDSSDRKTSTVKVTTNSIRETVITEGNKTENVRKNALKRNKNKLPSRPSHQNSLGETIHEEEDDENDGSTDEHEPQQHIYAVKILVSQNNPSSLDNVKPILKRESVYETPSIQTTTTKLPTESELGPTDPMPEDGNNSRKKVQFDQSHPIVCGGLTDDGGTESDDTLVWDDHKVIDGISQEEEQQMEGKEVTTTTTQVQATISWSDEQEGIIKTSSASNPFGVNNLTGEERAKNHRHQRGYPTEEKQNTTSTTTKEDIKVEGNRNELLHSSNNNNPPTTTSSFPNMKANRMVKTAERKTVQVRPSPSSPSSSVVQIMNPNSLLFHDTTRIRLNQSRPSIDQTFKINVGGHDGSSTKATRLKQSSSFRQMGSTPLRPRDPPPPPPPVGPVSKEPKSLQISGQKMSSKGEKRTTNGSWSKSTRASLNRKESGKGPNGTTSSPASKSNGGNVKTVPKQGDLQRKNRAGAEEEKTNIEIVTKENSVSEIRIYSGTQNLNINRDTDAAQILKNYGSNGSESQVKSVVSDGKSRPQSTSVVLIIDTSSSPDFATEHCSSYAKIKPMESPVKPVEEPSLKPAPIPAAQLESNEQHTEPESNAEPLYDDVIARAGQAEIKLNSNKMASLSRRSASPPPLPSIPPPLPSVPPPAEPFTGTGPSLYNKIRSIGQDSFQSIQDSEPMDSGLVYDDTISVLSSSYGTNSKVNDDDVPLYDDVLNLLTMDSDSGAETEEAIPPPLPAQRPTLPLPKTDLPMLNFPLLTKYMDKLSGQKDSKTVNVSASNGNMHSPASASPRKDVNSNNCDGSEDILDRTRSLLNELSQKFNTLKFASPADYATYISKVLISSSSDSSSGVEEDYGSEKNYPISDSGSTAMRNGTNNLASRSGAPALEALINARDRFLDSMKTDDEARKVEQQEGAGPILEEPIYEEIGDEGDDLNGPIYSDAFASKSMFDGASRNEILTFLEAIRERLSTTSTTTAAGDSSSNSLSRSVKERAEMERNDSGIGSGSESGSLVAVNGGGGGGTGGKNGAGSKSALSSPSSTQFICMDCNDTVDTTSATVTTGSNSPTHYGPSGTGSDLLIQASSSSASCSPSSPPSLCQSCIRKRRERKEILQEIYETEVKYGRDLRIIQEEFYNPIQIAGLLTRDQLEQIFLNVDQLVRVNTQLTGMLKSAIDEAVKAQDEDLTRVNMGKIFMEYGDTMMSSFENYCTQQASAGALLTQLEKEKELLRIFLRVSQMENSVLRRMNLPAFLMVPVQRVTRYPLLMARLLKVTPSTHSSRAELFAAQVKIEQHLESMNKRTREASSIRLWRRISIMNSNNSPAHRSPGNGDADDSPARIRKMALDVLDWANFTDVTCVAEGSFDTVEFNGKPLRNIHGCFLVRGKNLEVLARRMERPVFFPPKEDLGIDAKLVLVRIKNARFCLLREPLCLSKCVISQGENEYQDWMEINEITSKNTLFLRMNDVQKTSEWLRLLQCHAACCGHWRRRRGALANIMMNGMIRHL